MKKIFLPVLAVVGMALGLVFSSCGGGGGNDEAGRPAKALENMKFESVLTSPHFYFDMYQEQAGTVMRTVATVGTSAPCEATYVLTQNPQLVDFNGVRCWKFRGEVTLVGEEMLKQSAFKSLMNVNSQRGTISMKNWYLDLYIPAGEQSMLTYTGWGHMEAAGLYFNDSGVTKGEPLEFPTQNMQFIVEGKLTENFLSAYGDVQQGDGITDSFEEEK